MAKTINEEELDLDYEPITLFKEDSEYDIDENNKAFQLLCFLKSKTELYNRSLTDSRAMHDSTEAFLHSKEAISLSSNYYTETFITVIMLANKFKVDIENDIILNRDYLFTAQDWINIYEHMKQDNLVNWIEDNYRSIRSELICG